MLEFLEGAINLNVLLKLDYRTVSCSAYTSPAIWKGVFALISISNVTGLEG